VWSDRRRSHFGNADNARLFAIGVIKHQVTFAHSVAQVVPGLVVPHAIPVRFLPERFRSSILKESGSLLISQ
jgi:hypothetical protein